MSVKKLKHFPPVMPESTEKLEEIREEKERRDGDFAAEDRAFIQDANVSGGKFYPDATDAT